MIDLTHEITAAMPLPAGAVATELAPAAGLGGGIRLDAAAGTHVLTPAAVTAGGLTLEQFPLTQFFGLGVVLDVAAFAGGEIPPETLTALGDDLQLAQFLLLRSGWDRYWGEDTYRQGYPVLSAAAAALLAQLPDLGGVATDAPSLDAPGTATPVQQALAAGNKLAAVDLCHLELIQGRHCLLNLIPLPLSGLKACPVRALAFEAPAGIYYPGVQN